MSSRVSRVVAGPDGRAQGLFLHNGTFVNLSPALAQQVPLHSRQNAVSVSGPAYNSGSDSTIQAQQLTIGGASYNNPGGLGGAAAMPPQRTEGAPVLLPKAGAAGNDTANRTWSSHVTATVRRPGASPPGVDPVQPPSGALPDATQPAPQTLPPTQN